MKTLLPVAALAALLTGCAGIGAQSFYANPSAASTFEICKTLATGSPDMNFSNALRMELGRRGEAEAACPEVIKERETWVTVGVAAGVVALAVAAGKHSDVSIGVGGTIGLYNDDWYSEPTYTSYPPNTDREWAWDRYTGENGSQIWACRGVQTGALVDPSRCQGRPLADTVWPGPAAPFR